MRAGGFQQPFGHRVPLRRWVGLQVAHAYRPGVHEVVQDVVEDTNRRGRGELLVQSGVGDGPFSVDEVDEVMAGDLFDDRLP